MITFEQLLSSSLQVAIVQKLATNNVVPVAPGQPLNAPAPQNMSLSSNPVDNVRFPEIVYTDGYLNNPIEFTTTRDFYNGPIPLQLSSGTTSYERDIAQFVTVPVNNINDGKKFDAILAISPIYDRDKFYRTFDVSFKEFGVVNG